MWRWADVKMSRCEDEQMWRWADVKMSRCEDEQMWRWADVREDLKMSRCEDEQMWEKMWRWSDVKMSRCEDEQMWEKIWRWADVKMRRCEDEQMRRWADVKMRRCEDEKVWQKVWRWEGVKMRRCEDEKMWRWEGEIQTPTIGRTLRSDALGKNVSKSHSCLYFNFEHAQQSGLCGHCVLCVGVLKGSCSSPLDMWCLWRYPCLEWLPSSRCCDVGFCWMWKCVSETVDIALSRQNIPNSVGEGISWRKLCPEPRWSYQDLSNAFFLEDHTRSCSKNLFRTSHLQAPPIQGIFRTFMQGPFGGPHHDLHKIFSQGSLQDLGPGLHRVIEGPSKERNLPDLLTSSFCMSAQENLSDQQPR